MKTYRTVIVVLSVLVLWLGYLQLSRTRKPASEPPKDMLQTTSAELWQTNTVPLWHTNTVELWRTNTVVQNFTNEVIKEVAAQLSPAAKLAAIAGYKYLNAPSSGNSAESLYNANPIAVDVVVNAYNKSVVVDDPGIIRKNVEAALQARSIPIAESSPHRLRLTITPVWKNDMPSVALLAFRLDLREKVALQRQGDVLLSDGIVWSTVGAKLIRTVDPAAELKTAMQEQLDKFCDDYLKAKETEKDLKSRIPTMPNDFLSGA